MTRRKRSLSPVTARKRAVFEIPASLHHFSALSRSLVKQVDSTSSPDTTGSNSTALTKLPLQTRSQDYNQNLPLNSSFENDSVSPFKFVPQNHSFPVSQPWPQPQPENLSPSFIDHHALYRRRQDAAAYSETQRPSNSTIAPQPHQAQSENVAPQTREPVARPGETLSLARHPGQIAALIARKRAENEANRNRERWARAQSEHLAKTGLPPSTGSSTDGHSQAASPSHSRNPSSSSVNASQSAQLSTHLAASVGIPLRSIDGPHHNHSSTDSAVDSRMHDLQPNSEIDTLFSTSLTSPRQYDRGLDLTSEPIARHQRTRKRDGSHQLPSPTVSVPSQPDTQRPQSSASMPKSHSNSKSLSNADMIPIPPLFSDAPKGMHTTAQPQRPVHHGISRSQSNPVFTPPAPQLNHQPRSTPQSYQMQQQSPQPAQQPQFSTNNMPGYYKVNPPLWGVLTNSNIPMSSQPTDYSQPVPVLASNNNTSTYYNPNHNEMNMYQNMAPNETNYANYQGNNTGGGHYRNSASGSFGPSKR